MLAIKLTTDTGKWLFKTESNQQTDLQRQKYLKNIENCKIYATVLMYKLRIYTTVPKETCIYAGSLKEICIYTPLWARKTTYIKDFKKNKKQCEEAGKTYNSRTDHTAIASKQEVETWLAWKHPN